MNNRKICARQIRSLFYSTMLFTNHKGLATLRLIQRNIAMKNDLIAAFNQFSKSVHTHTAHQLKKPCSSRLKSSDQRANLFKSLRTLWFGLRAVFDQTTHQCALLHPAH